MVKLLLFTLAICFFACMSESAKILIAFPFPSKSHANLGNGFVRILREAGHEITYITPFPNKDTTNLRHIDVSASLEAFKKVTGGDDGLNLEAIIEKRFNPVSFERLKHLADLVNTTFAIDHMQKLVNDPNEKFDLVIIEWMFTEAYSGLAAVFDCPYVWFSSVNPHFLVLSLIDEAPNPSYNTDIFSPNIPPLNFFQRIRELFSQVLWTVIKTVVLKPPEKQHYYDIFGPLLEKRRRPLPSFEEIVHSASLMLGNSDVSTGRAMTLPDNYKHIAGFHIDPSVKPLPEDLKKIIENAKYGVIYFSLGSNVKSKDLPQKVKQSLLKMFGGLKYTVLWKFEEELSDLPKNVHILDWAPQPSILSHPNCKVFITHGGLLSTIETINFGVPIIGIPVFADQFINVDLAKKKGFALRVDLSYEMADDLKIAIEEIVDNPKYKQKVDELNFIFHDRPVTPAKELAHWVNHVIRTKGAPHLRSAAVMMPWYQKYYVDFLALVLAIVYIIVKAMKWLCCSRKKTKQNRQTVGAKKHN